MALINCKECKKEISSDVKQCPHCGSSKHRGFVKKHPILTIFIGLFAIGYIPTLFVDEEKIAKQKQQENQEKKNKVQEEIKKELKSTSEKKENISEEKVVEKPTIIDNWKYEINEDKMRGTKKIFAMSKSKNILQLGFPYNDSQMRITVRNMDKETDVLISVKGQIVCNEYSERCYLNVKSDNNQIVKYDFVESAHGNSDTVFIKKPKDFINMLKKSNQLIIEAPLYDHGRAQYEFDVSGLKWDE